MSSEITQNSNAIEIAGLHYSYRSDWLYKSMRSLEDVSLTVKVGEAFGFLGPNGAGKTTTIKCLLNLIQPSKGLIKIFGSDSRTEAARMLVGYLPEQPYFYDHLTVKETLEMYGTLAGIGSAELTKAIKEALELVGMTGRLSSAMRSLSKGLTQRVGLAQALVAKPRLLVLDEPFSGLDPIGRKEFFDIFNSLKKTGTAIFMSSHVLSDVEALCDRVSILVKGKLKGIYNVSEISSLMSGAYELALRQPVSFLEQLPKFQESTVSDRFLKLKYSSEAEAQKALSIALQNKASIEEFSFVCGGLEEFFVKLVKNS